MVMTTGKPELRFSAGLVVGLLIGTTLCAQKTDLIKRNAPEDSSKYAFPLDTSKSIPYQWNLGHIYSGEEAWKQDFEKLKSYQGMMGAYKNDLTASAQRLLEGLRFRDQINLLSHRLQSWAEKRVQKNITDTTRISLVNQLSQLSGTLEAEQAFIDATLLAVDPEQLQDYFTIEPGLAIYKPYLDDLLRTRSNRLSSDATSLIAHERNVLDFSQSMFKAIKQDLKFMPVNDGNGNMVPIADNYASLMDSRDPQVRKDAYTSRMNGYFEHKNALAKALASEVDRDIFLARSHGFSSCLDWSLLEEAVPAKVFKNYLSVINQNVYSLQKWLYIRKRLLGVDSLTLADMYVPLPIPGAKEEKYDYDESLKLANKALAPLGESYLSIFLKAQTQGWIDVFPSPEKDPWLGSATMVYGVHPFILLNWDSSMFSLKTLVHEMGHAISLNYIAEDEPFLYQRWWYCTSEVPSTCNEILLKEYMLANTHDKIEKLVLLQDEIDRMAHLLFNLGLESEFELVVHNQAEKGGTLSPDWFLSTYHQLAQKYYGSSISLCPLDNMQGLLALLNNHWGTCYVRYVYSLGYCASQNFAKRLIAREPNIQNTYRRFLGRGRAHYPIDALKEAGVDVTTSAPFEETLKDFVAKVDQFESLLKEVE